MTDIIRYFNNQEIHLVQTDDEKVFYIDLKMAGLVLGVSEKTLMHHMRNHADEFTEDEDFCIVQILHHGRKYKKRVLYPEGFILMSMFVRSKVAIQARKWIKRIMADLITGKSKIVSSNLDYIMRSARKIADQINYNRVTTGKLPVEDMYDVVLKCLIEINNNERESDPIDVVVKRWLGQTIPLLPEEVRRLLR